MLEGEHLAMLVAAAPLMAERQVLENLIKKLYEKI